MKGIMQLMHSRAFALILTTTTYHVKRKGENQGGVAGVMK